MIPFRFRYLIDWCGRANFILAASLFFVSGLMAFRAASATDDPVLTAEQLAAVEKLEQRRITAVQKVIGSVVAIYGDDRQGGGSGVIIDPSGIALTNHHVVLGAGVTGWGGLADGKLYRWELIGTDPGGDVAIIQLSPTEPGKPFPYSPLGDSDNVRVGDWALAMGNPFILTEDQKPTVTLGIVSGVKRYQPGAGDNQLVYGNCIQVDSSINPGNSGGPLFNLDGRVIGINGRGSFKDRGRVNVGLGYAISANQIKNFIPDLLATKLAEHATLDVQFEDRSGKVICTRRNQDAPAAQAGIELGDELIRFEGQTIQNANQFTNLICTLPEDWPVELTIGKPDGTQKNICTRALGLPYRKPPRPEIDPDMTPEEKKAAQRQLAMIEILSAQPGKTRRPAVNRRYAAAIVDQARQAMAPAVDQSDLDAWRVRGQIRRDGKSIGTFGLRLGRKPGFEIKWTIEGEAARRIRFDGQQVFDINDDDEREIGLNEALRKSAFMYAFGMAGYSSQPPLDFLTGAMIDGSDKTDRQNAYRLKCQLNDTDRLYCWLQIYPASGLPQPTLRKLSADRDGKTGAMMLDAPVEKSGLVIPANGYWVAGLAERQLLQFQVDTIEDAKILDQPTVVDPPEFETPQLSRPEDRQATASLQSTIDQAQPALVKIFGASAGRVQGSTTGFFISDDGLILTSQGVYLDGRRVQVVTADGSQHSAVVLKRDRQRHLALLKIDAASPDYFSLSDRAQIETGDWIIAICNAFKVADKDEPISATLGIVSLRTRMEAKLTKRDYAYRGELFLIDAITSNPSAAGGAVLTADGRLAGMVGKIINSSETNTRLNYAVPQEVLFRFVNDLDQPADGNQIAGRDPVTPGELGIVIFRLGGKGSPAYVDRIKRRSAAAQAKLKTDDLIVSIGGQKIGNVKEYDAAVKKMVAGEAVLLIYKRGSRLLRTEITPIAKKSK